MVPLKGLIQAKLERSLPQVCPFRKDLPLIVAATCMFLIKATEMFGNSIRVEAEQSLGRICPMHLLP
jgi:hypothetical protein